jgi:hypothetical protein
MAIVALNSLYVAVASATTGGTAPGGSSAPTGCTLSSPFDLSPYVTGVSQEGMAATQEVTTFGSGGFQAFVAGLKSGSLTLEMLNDYAATLVNARIGLNGSVVPVGSTSPIFIEVRLNSGSRSTSNPGFICAAINRNFQTFNASVGSVPTVSWSPQITGGFAELVA